MKKHQNLKRLTKAVLSSSIVIGQFDKKFIILKVIGTCDSLYIVVDQHALHERILLEKGSLNPCKLAIKFNDVLEIDFMKYMVRQIPLMKNPWVCAHGRPCFAILCDLK